jgi:hypothetical protein
MARALSMSGHQGMEEKSTTRVLLMVTLTAYMPLLWAQLATLGSKLTMMRTVQEKWQSPSAITLELGQDQATNGMLTIKW